MDQYRVTREMPLPYRVQDQDDDDDDEDGGTKSPVEDDDAAELDELNKPPSMRGDNRNEDGEAGNFN